jgi:hypothetical protein
MDPKPAPSSSTAWLTKGLRSAKSRPSSTRGRSFWKSHRFPSLWFKTTGGKVIGEYYYDPQVYKNRRHYIFNSKFFAEQLRIAVRLLSEGFDQAMYTEMLQMIQDAHKRVTENKSLHFENSTNEILNEKSLRELWQLARAKSYGDLKTVL